MPARRVTRFHNIALLIEPVRAYGRQILRGVSDYAKVHGPWLFYLPSDEFDAMPDPHEWEGDGIIAQPHQNSKFIDQLKASGVPVVSLSGPPGNGYCPTVLPNHHGVVEQAIQHFRERGFTKFGYCGDADVSPWSRIGALFIEKLAELGFDCHQYDPAAEEVERNQRLTHLARWLRSLPKPTALLAKSDSQAREVLDACRIECLQVPDEVAVLGVNNDDLICELANPPLSSVIHNARRIGYEAAAMLDKMLNKQPIETMDISVDPMGVKSRQSTDLLAIEDIEVAKAVRYIRDNASHGIRVQDVLGQVAVSRRALEMRFRNVVGRPPHEEIRRVQLQRVKDLLVTTDYKLERVAELCGFSTAQYLAGLFHRETGMTPGTFRRQGRPGGKV
ncbi:MAG: transcriptional regulator [Phycisphaerales bacterium]|nr:transcriptional regulator [Phycisphaerales bacterium]